MLVGATLLHLQCIALPDLADLVALSADVFWTDWEFNITGHFSCVECVGCRKDLWPGGILVESLLLA